MAGYAARILQSNPSYTPADVRTALLNNSIGTLDTTNLNPRDSNGVEIPNTPNKFLRFGDVNITSQVVSRPEAESGPTTLTVGASGTTTPLSYQWYEVRPTNFDYKNFKQGAAGSIQLAGETSATLSLSNVTERKAYWVRVTNSYGSSDSDIAVVVPRPNAPSGASAGATGRTVDVTWTPASGTDIETYQVQRKINSVFWTVAGERPATATTFSETFLPADPAGMIVYRVAATAGADYLPPHNLATSASNNDIANLKSGTYDAITVGTTSVRAKHLTELRVAVNELCAAAGTPPAFSAAEVQESSLLGQAISRSQFTTLLDALNNVRSALGLSSLTFGETITSGVTTVKRAHLMTLRNGLE